MRVVLLPFSEFPDPVEATILIRLRIIIPPDDRLGAVAQVPRSIFHGGSVVVKVQVSGVVVPDLEALVVEHCPRTIVIAIAIAVALGLGVRLQLDGEEVIVEFVEVETGGVRCRGVIGLGMPTGVCCGVGCLRNMRKG